MPLPVIMSLLKTGVEAAFLALGRSNCSEIFLAVGCPLACLLRPRVLLAEGDSLVERKSRNLEGFRGVFVEAGVADDEVCCWRGVFPLA